MIQCERDKKFPVAFVDRKVKFLKIKSSNIFQRLWPQMRDNFVEVEVSAALLVVQIFVKFEPLLSK